MWRTGVTIRPVAPQHPDRHVIHSYFNTCPESPDGNYVLYYTSPTSAGENGDLRILNRHTGKETIIADQLRTEDAHRVACQQWSNGGKHVVYHDLRDGQWRVMSVDIATLEIRELARDRQVCFGSVDSPWVPMYGCHWNPGPHRDIELVHVESGEIRTAVKVEEVVEAYGDWLDERFGSREISLFFPNMSPGDRKVFFKLALPSGGNDFRSKKASLRDGMVVYDLENRGLIRMIQRWRHPSWTSDSTAIFNNGNYFIDVASGETRYVAPSCFSNHPALSPDSRLFVTDGSAGKHGFGKERDWGIAVGSTEKDEFVVLHTFDNSKGATTWRRNHPHPVFNADGRRIYYNVNDGPWTTLMVAEE